MQVSELGVEVYGLGFGVGVQDLGQGLIVAV